MGRLSTVLGKDSLVLQRFEGADYLSQLSEYQVDCLAITPDIDFDALIGTHATVSLVTHDGEERPFDGIITEARWMGPGENGHRYRLIVKPWFWLATCRRNQRIFHNKTVVQILSEIFADYASAGTAKIALTAEYPELEYTVQYRESDFAFASRMMERFGISYHFTHTKDSHAMVLTDAVESHGSIGSRPYKPADGHHQEEVEHFRDWRPARRITTGATRLTDYNFKTPNAAMEVEREGDAAYAQGTIESFDYPGDYLEQGRGRVVATMRLEGERGQDRRFQASGDIPALGGGVRVVLTGDPVPGKGEEFICLSARHSYVSDSYGSGGPASDGYAYSGAYVLMPSTAPLKPELKTARALVQGPQTAVVVGEGEIDCDEYGRILVRFHWDLAAAHSMRCRVSQSWAGNGWGGMVIPRIGMEVVVEFLEGDPDKPLVTGCVYNGRNATPYPLPEHKTKSVFRSDTHQGPGFNEFTFEDEKGRENISLHAQKDQTLKVLNNRMKRVDNDQVESVGQDKSIDVGKNHQEKIGGSMNLMIGGGAIGAPIAAGLAALTALADKRALRDSEEVKDPFVTAFIQATSEGGAGIEALSLAGGSAFHAAGKHRAIAGAEQIAAGSALGGLLSSIMPLSGIRNTIIEKAALDTIGLARTEQIGLFKNTMVGHTQVTTVGQKQRTSVGKSRSVHVGESDNKFVGENMNISVGQTFTLTVGKSSLTLQEDGTIILSGVHLEINGQNTIKATADTIDLN